MRWLQSLALAVLCTLIVLLAVAGDGTPAVLAQEPEPTATRPPVLPIETPTVEPTVVPTATPVPIATPEPPAESPANEPVAASAPVTALLPEAGAPAPLMGSMIAVGVLLLASGLLLARHAKRR